MVTLDRWSESVCVCERERERVETQGVDTENTQVENVYSQRRKTQHITKWEEGALYRLPLSLLTTRLMEHGE